MTDSLFYFLLDANECENGNPCHHVCNNVSGSFQCDCFDGFVLSADNVTCTRMSISRADILTDVFK